MGRLRALVTGAASGIGRALALELVQRGHLVLAADRNAAGLQEVCQRCPDSALGVELDVTREDSWRRAIGVMRERLGGIDVLFNVAGVLVPGWFHEQPASVIDATIDVNVKGVMHGTRVAVQAMRGKGGGHVVNVASLAAIASVPGIAVYSASKHAVRAFSLAVAEELRPEGVAVTVVCPGPVATPMLDAQVHHDEAAITFTAPRALDPAEVVAVLTGRVLAERPLEVLVTVPGSGQGLLARVMNAFPSLARRARPLATRLGRRNQDRFRAR